MKRSSILVTVILISLGAFLLVFAWSWWVEWRYSRDIYTVEAAPAGRVAIVYGALVYPNGRLSSMLRDRVETAVQLYEAGKVHKIIFSGDNQSAAYDEPGAMMAYAAARGVPAEAMQPDYGGRRTYDTCYRARAIFGVEQAILVTQEFHLPRALFTCRALGVTAIGVSADLRTYGQRAIRWSTFREMPARFVALVDVLRRQPPPVMGRPIAMW